MQGGLEGVSADGGVVVGGGGGSDVAADNKRLEGLLFVRRISKYGFFGGGSLQFGRVVSPGVFALDFFGQFLG